MKNKLNHQNKPKSQSKLKITTRCNGCFGVFTSGKLRTVFSAIMLAFFDNANCVELWSLENKYSLLWSTLNVLKTIKWKMPTHKWFWQISRTLKYELSLGRSICLTFVFTSGKLRKTMYGQSCGYFSTTLIVSNFGHWKTNILCSGLL